MSATKKKSGRFKIGDWVEFPYGTRKLIAEVVEARGPLGVNRRHLYRLRVAEKQGEIDSFEMPEDELTLAASRPTWFLEERANAFVSGILAKHDGVVRPYAGRDMGIDRLIEVLKDGKPTMRFFGAQLVAYMDLPTIQNADEGVLSHLGRDESEVNLPLCVFVVGIRKPEGLYRWVVEPAIENGHPVLRRQPRSRCEVKESWITLDDAGTASLIGQINAWYDALNGGAPRSQRRHPKAES